MSYFLNTCSFKLGLYLAQAVQMAFFLGLVAQIAACVRHRIWMRESRNSMVCCPNCSICRLFHLLNFFSDNACHGSKSLFGNHCLDHCHICGTVCYIRSIINYTLYWRHINVHQVVVCNDLFAYIWCLPYFILVIYLSAKECGKYLNQYL